MLFMFHCKADYSFTIATGPENATYHQVGGSLDLLDRIAVKTVSTKGSQENIQLLKDKKVDIALVQLDIYNNLLASDKELEKNIKILLPLYSEEVHLLASKNIRSIKDLKRKRVCLGDAESGTRGTAQIIIDVYKLTDKFKMVQCGFEDGLKMLNAKRLDALFLVAGAPVKSLKKLKSKNIHLVPFQGKGYKFLTAGYFSYVKKSLNKKTYQWLKKKVKTLAVESAIITRRDLPVKSLKFLARKIIRERKKLATKHEKWKQVDYKEMKKFYSKNKEHFHKASVSIFSH